MAIHLSDRRLGHSILLLLGAANCPGLAQDIKGAVEPPILGRYEGSVIKEQSVRAFDQTTMATQFKARGLFERIPVEGRRTVTALQGPRGRSALEIFTNYANALKSAGFRTLYACGRDNCPAGMLFEGLSPDLSSELRRPLAVYGNGSTEDKHYLVASRNVPGGTEYVRIAAMGPSLPVVVLDIVQPAAMETRVKVVDAASVRSELSQRGRIALYAVFFDFDRAELKPESKPQLEELAKYLRADALLKAFIVGHTDATDRSGKVEYNLELSRRRAQAVVDGLVGLHQIAVDRISAYGVGPLAPLASNDTDDGRALNRRVEVVKRMP